MPERMPARWHIIFRGQVQQVGFRYTSFFFCRRLRLSGWVRNLDDGSVEMEVQGGLSSLRRLIMLLKAVVHITGTDISTIPVDVSERRFRVL